MEKFGSIYEHSPWVAERAWQSGITKEHDTVEIFAALMARIVDEAEEPLKWELIAAHPDLAGKAAVKGASRSGAWRLFAGRIRGF